MPHSPARTPALRLVEPPAAEPSAFRRGLPSAVVGTLIGVASLIPFVMSVLSR